MFANQFRKNVLIFSEKSCVFLGEGSVLAVPPLSRKTKGERPSAVHIPQPSSDKKNDAARVAISLFNNSPSILPYFLKVFQRFFITHFSCRPRVGASFSSYLGVGVENRWEGSWQ